MRDGRLYAWHGSFWRAMGGTVEHPSLMRLGSFDAYGLEPTITEPGNGRVLGLAVRRQRAHAQ